jgi:hypothetical protein
MTYERIRTRDGKNLILKDTREIEMLGVPCLIGAQVDREGAPLLKTHVIDLEAIKIRKPMVMSNYYGELVYLDQRS